MKKIIILLLTSLPLFTNAQSEKYQLVIDYITDSIIQESEEYYIQDTLWGTTDYGGFHGLSTDCPLQHSLIVEILFNGEIIYCDNIIELIPNKLNTKAKNKIQIAAIRQYGNIWAISINVKNIENIYKFDKYSLIFIDDKLIMHNVSNCHID